MLALAGGAWLLVAEVSLNKLTSGAKARFASSVCGTAEAVPLRFAVFPEIHSCARDLLSCWRIRFLLTFAFLTEDSLSSRGFAFLLEIRFDVLLEIRSLTGDLLSY
jgi:hypothetical protein